MGLFDFLKQREFAEIICLKKDLEILANREIDFNNKIDKLKEECASLSRFKEVADLDNRKEEILSTIRLNQEKEIKEKEVYQHKIELLKSEIDILSKEICNKKSQVIELDEAILLQEFGFYKPMYDFANSEAYKDRLDAIRSEQKNMILNKTAAKCSTVWTIDGSEAKGRAMTEQNIKQILRCFNDECDTLINKVKFNNVLAFSDKIWKSCEQLNRINSKNHVSLSPDYAKLKVDELQLAYEYAVKKQEEKEEQKRIREQMREEAKLQKEIEDARKDIEKEQKHYTNALLKLNKQLDDCSDTEKEMLLEKKTEIESHLTDLDIAIKDIDYREANKRAGYVYVISNIGSFGEDVYKIGMTRRLEPMERVDELGDASVPFKFDVHAMIFSDDAPKLESALHRAFEHKKVNMINNRREFFKVTIEEIKQVVKENYDKTVDFETIPQAEQYRESIKILESISMN
ncbi:DUF4041 domain-containing protein [Bacteroides sp.]|uniref:DUF4041 domain-containing protein n=1 Tax=Bacteroides sp. TaxID=29523 RepID=UPI002FCAFC83